MLCRVKDDTRVGTYQAGAAHKVTIVVHHIGTLLVVVSLSFPIRSTRWIESHPIERTMAVNAVFDLILWGGLQSFLIRSFDGFNWAQLAVEISFRVNCIVWSFMVILKKASTVQAVDDVRINELTVSGVPHCASWAARMTTGVIVVVTGALAFLLWLDGEVLEISVKVDRRDRRGSLASE